jgi:transposase
MACRTARALADRGLFPPEDYTKVVTLATTRPADLGLPFSHWSLSDLAFHILQDAHDRDMSRSTIQRLLAGCAIRPHRCRYWLHNEDPDFERLALQVCQLYLQAPALHENRELVLCVDEKTGIQALERKHPTLPLAPGRCERMEFEYIRHGTRCLTATWVVPTGQVLGTVTIRRTTADFCRHIRRVARQLADVKRCHWVMDNLNTHWSLELCRLMARLSGVRYEAKTLRRGAQRRAFLTDPRHQHVVVYTPKHGSWLNQIEMWFSVLTRRVLRRGEFRTKSS